MHLDRMKTLSFIAALTLAYGCASKNSGDDTGVGGGYNVGSGGAGFSPGGNTSVSAAGGSSAADFDPATYCGGIFQGRSCGATQVSADVRVVNMLLVLDSSGSMGKSLTTNGPTKWVIMQQALTSALTKVQNDINFGLLLYPYKEGGIDSNSDAFSEVCAVPDSSAAAVNIPIGSGATAVQAVDRKPGYLFSLLRGLQHHLHACVGSPARHAGLLVRPV